MDLGSGKGYLSQTLSKLYNLNVLAIDASQGNTDGAQKRIKNLDVKNNTVLIHLIEYYYLTSIFFCSKNGLL